MQQMAAEAQLAVIALAIEAPAHRAVCTTFSISIPAAFRASTSSPPSSSTPSTAQSESLGFEPAVVYVPHPIQNRTKEEIEALADAAFEKVLAALKSS